MVYLSLRCLHLLFLVLYHSEAVNAAGIILLQRRFRRSHIHFYLLTMARACLLGFWEMVCCGCRGDTCTGLVVEILDGRHPRWLDRKLTVA